ncbi:D-Ala-D-Ala carboxypeptidase family metallohydrolase [Candidatus Proelusimicrobium excrementi]|uniref:D-Ala-D-Ala carboxypeptidase family metallohydrolase n=1 Tax=Candidatus Proelusimicrobium excrementi TaxID=3416222 RepID=UPI003D0B9245
MIKISPHFSFEELVFTSFHDFKALNSLEGEKRLPELTALSFYLLEPVRRILNSPLKITSAYRCRALNSFVGGSASSQHLKGEAADFIPLNVGLDEAFAKIKNCTDLHFGQLISEPGWLHISLGTPFRDLKKCGQAFIK